MQDRSDLVEKLKLENFQSDDPKSRSTDFSPNIEEDNDPKYLDQTRVDDLSPDQHEGNDPEAFEFKMPSHKELQEKYKTVSTSASEIINSIAGWPRGRIAYDKLRIQL